MTDSQVHGMEGKMDGVAAGRRQAVGPLEEARAGAEAKAAAAEATI